MKRIRIPTRTPIALLAILVLAAPLARGQAPAGQGWGKEHPAHEVARVLLESSPSKLGDDLAKLGATALPDLFEVLATGRIPIRVGEHGNSSRELEPSHERAVLGTFSRLPYRRVIAFLDVLSGEPLEPEAQRAALRILAELGTGEELSLVARVGTPAQGAIARRPVREAFEQALVRILERDPSSVRDVPSLYARAHPSYLGPIAAALGQRASHERLLALSRLLGKVAEADRLVLIEIGRMAPRVSDPDQLALSNVRPYLRAADLQVLTEATMAVGRLEDRGAVPRLIELIDHRDPTVARAALDALRGMSGKVIGARPESWTEWYRKEMEWWRHEAPGELGVAASGSPEQASRVILQLSKKRLFKNELAEPLAASLERSEPELVVLACAALGHLGSRKAVPHLIRCLERENQDMQTAAWRALRRITGLELGADPQLWKPHIQG